MIPEPLGANAQKGDINFVGILNRICVDCDWLNVNIATLQTAVQSGQLQEREIADIPIADQAMPNISRNYFSEFLELMSKLVDFQFCQAQHKPLPGMLYSLKKTNLTSRQEICS